MTATPTPEKLKHVVIHIGGIHASREPVVVETLLGSCVAACLFDPVNRVGGMNHFLLPSHSHGDPLLTRYGHQAMEALLRRILNLGGQMRHLRAKAFGAASVLDMDESLFNVPRANEAFVRKFLAEVNVPLVAERMGGKKPMVVQLHTDDGTAHVREVGDRK